MAKKAGMAFFIIDGDSISCHKNLNCLHYFTEDGGLQLTVSTTDDTVAPFGVKTDCQSAVWIFTYGILGLISIAVLSYRWDNGQHFY